MFLVTTPLTRFDEPNRLLLGPWCRVDGAQTASGPDCEMSHQLVTVDEKQRCNREARDLANRLMPDLFRELNTIHGASHTFRFWKVVCQRWLLGFVDVVYQRWNLIDRVLREYDVEIAGGVALQDDAITSRTSQSFNLQREDHWWNAQIFTAILRFRGVRIVEVITPSLQSGVVVSQLSKQKRTGIEKITGALSRRSSVFIADTYLPRWKELLLAARLGSFPVRLHRNPIASEPYSSSMRQSIDLSPADDGSLESFLRRNLGRWIPMSWVEDFNCLADPNHSKDFPRSPRKIFTGNAHLSNDHFTIWAASKTEEGAQVVFSQHGGLYGEGEVRSRNEEHELDVADNYVTWGWRDARFSNIVTAPSQLAKNRQVRRRRADQLLVVMDTTFRYSRYSWESRAERNLYLETSATMVAELPPYIRENTMVRLHHDHDRYDDGHLPFFEKIPGIGLDDYSKPISTSIRKSRLVVVTTLSTTFIENIWGNVPTIIYAHPSIYEIRMEYRKVFDELASVGVFHESSLAAGNFASAVWNSVDAWWGSDEVMRAVRRYGETFAGFKTEQQHSLTEILQPRHSVSDRPFED